MSFPRNIFFISIFSVVLFSGCSYLFYQPTNSLYFPPELLDLEYERIKLKTSDGVELAAWYFRPKTPVRGTVIQFHGNGQNMSSHYTSLIWLTKSGYGLFVFDYRGYGVSDGKPSQEGTTIDALTALSEALKIHQRNSPIGSRWIVYGQSLGGAIALRALVDFQDRDKVSLVVADSTFISYRDVAREQFSKFWLTWPFSWLGQILISEEYAPKKTMGQLAQPLLVIHDTHDPVVGFENGEDLFCSAKNSVVKRFWKLGEGHHISIFYQNQEAQNLFLRYLETGGACTANEPWCGQVNCD